MDKVYFFILNVFLNSFLAFLTVAFLIEALIFLFRVRQGRLAALLRMIPLVKLPVDLCLYDFSRWSYLHGANPWHCEENTRALSAMCGWMSDGIFLPITSAIQLTMPGNMTFTIADLLALSISPWSLKVFVLLFLLLSAGLLIRKLLLHYRSATALNLLNKSARPMTRAIDNPILSSYIKCSGMQLMTSHSIQGSPFVAGVTAPTVYIPSSLINNLSRVEYEAVLAHELGHVRFKDNGVRLILDSIGAIFWWVPTQWWSNRIEEGLEVGCDRQCKRYGVDPNNLAAALYKSAKHAIHHPCLIFAHHLTKHAIFKRVNRLLQPASRRFKTIHFVFSCFAVGIAFLVIFLGRFWIF